MQYCQGRALHTDALPEFCYCRVAGKGRAERERGKRASKGLLAPRITTSFSKPLAAENESEFGRIFHWLRK